jgi:hypothetical protein
VAVADANYVRNVEAAYVDDTYKILPNLTVSAGLRYELTPPWNDTLGNNFTVDIQQMPKENDISTTYPQSQWPFYVRQGNCTPANVYQGLAIKWTTALGPAPVCSNGTLPNGPLLDTQYTDFAPRLGISYSPNSKMVIRTGYGIFFSQDIGNAYFDMARNIAGRVTQTNADSQAGIFGNSNLTWNNAAPGGSGAVANLPPSQAYADALSVKHSAAGWTGLVVRGGLPGCTATSPLWVQECKRGVSIRLHWHRGRNFSRIPDALREHGGNSICARLRYR